MSIEQKLDSYEYKCKVSEHLTALLKRVSISTNEAQVAFAFQSEIYMFAHTFLNKKIDFNQEENQSSLRHKFIGRMDAICNNLVIEYKKVGKLEKEKDKVKATEQISNYMYQLKEEEGNEYYGILTDGIKLRYSYFQNGVIYHTAFKNLDESDLDKIIRSLIDNKNKKFLPKNIVSDFSVKFKDNYTYKLAQYLFKQLNLNFEGKCLMLFKEWKSLFHLSENDKGQNEDITKRRNSLSKLFDITIKDNDTDYKALFALQTTYAIIIKLIACKIITKIEFNKNIEYFSDLSKIESNLLRDFFQYTEDGYIFQTGGIKNLLEGDFFSWYCSTEVWSDEITKILIGLINIIEGYSHASYTHGYSTTDIFIDLYMEIMPSEVRHSLGEYFTPSWLANYVVERSVEIISNKKSYIAIDPCCGSGVFIMALIKQMIGNTDLISLTDREKDILLNSIITRVKGVDINPLSVLTAKVSFYMAIRPLINNHTIEIPIYLGDSANIPNKLNIDKIDCYEYIIKTEKENIEILLPSAFVESDNFFYSMSQIQSSIKSEKSDFVFNKFRDFIGKENLNIKIEEAIKNLSNQLVELHKKNWDGIWIRIVANFMLVGRIRNVDLIVGNPPWVKWEFLPQEYAEKIKSLCIEKHIFSGQTYMGAISLNICALIANVTASEWLTEDGLLAFLMPQTLMTQDSYSGFRNFYTNFARNERMYLQKLDDWTKSGNPFVDTTEKFMTYYYQKKKVDYYKDGIPINVLVKKKGISMINLNQKQMFKEIETSFEQFSSKAYQMDEERTGYTTLSDLSIQSKENFKLIIGECMYKARSGVEFTPAEIYFLEAVEKVNTKGYYLFKSSKFKNSKYKNISNLPLQLETKYIKPVIKAPQIVPFGHIEDNNYCIFPYIDKITTSVEIDVLMNESPSLFNYFISTKKVIEKQSKRSLTISRGKDFYSLSKVGKYTFSPNKVTFRDNTKLSAMVVKEIKTPWGENLEPICAKHCPYISQDKTGRDISEDEAFYLCGILNTNIVGEYFKSTYSTRSYSINFNIKMPLYNNNNKLHRLIMKLSRRATNKGVTEKIYKLLEKCYLDLCREC